MKMRQWFYINPEMVNSTLCAQPGYIIEALLSVSDDIINPLGAVFDLWNNDHDMLAGSLIRTLIDKRDINDINEGLVRLLNSPESLVGHLFCPKGSAITSLFEEFLEENGIVLAIT